MSEIKDGGPAFPVPEILIDENICHPSVYQGMTMRDYFAGQALVGLLSSRGYHERNIAAMDAYNLADAMLTAREGV